MIAISQDFKDRFFYKSSKKNSKTKKNLKKQKKSKKGIDMKKNICIISGIKSEAKKGTRI